ncbi:MAG TPA: anthranilate phosphoribosyltransferase [Planctomycetota bacterium]|nr:anthranilate phosphoribosyltransferase [Planctomycetota bacterium]HRR81638.1 anthranilate phosphoribosyltransferase [Planctomycetota bacterium]
MLKELISKLVSREALSAAQAEAAMDEIMSGGATEAQIAAFAVALRMKGETVDEIAGCARAMRAKATRIQAPRADLLDTCGTGGDAIGTFNISTAAALVAAGAGCCVAKHGNRGVSSSCGSADVLRELGVKIDAPVAAVERSLRDAGIGFLFAPALHGAMKHAIGPRREIGIRTVFNILGPLTNPAGARHQLLGVYEARLVKVMAAVLASLGCVHCLVVHGDDGLDELTTTTTTQACEVRNGRLLPFTIRPEDAGLPRAQLDDLRVSSAAESASVIRGVLGGRRGPARDIVVLNAAAALLAAERADDLRQGCLRAAAAIDAGAAARALDRLIAITNAQ